MRVTGLAGIDANLKMIFPPFYGASNNLRIGESNFITFEIWLDK